MKTKPAYETARTKAREYLGLSPECHKTAWQKFRAFIRNSLGI